MEAQVDALRAAFDAEQAEALQIIEGDEQRERTLGDDRRRMELNRRSRAAGLAEDMAGNGSGSRSRKRNS
jgi:hypothetical protein